jgi:DNA-binding transcriptional ArsR family regulator
VRNSAQLAYQAPLPSAITSVPAASGRSTVGTALGVSHTALANHLRRLRERDLVEVACLDSSEGRPHLGGALGAELARTLIERGWVEPEPGTRTARVTPAGKRALRPLLGSQAV